jgi:CRP/FNR family transcriptional regulator, cyclic AMP receptor protein
LLSVQKQEALTASVNSRTVECPVTISRVRRCRSAAERSSTAAAVAVPFPLLQPFAEPYKISQPAPAIDASLAEVDPLYLFACQVEWERREEPSAGWELLSAAQSQSSDTRAHARSILTSSRHLGGNPNSSETGRPKKRQKAEDAEMTAPYDLEIVDNCCECTSVGAKHFCRFSTPVLEALTQVSHKSTLPAGAILFVEGQAPRGMFIVCSGRVKLSTTSREGKILILKTAEAGEALGLSATISGLGYELTAETATPCLLSFIDRKHYLELMETYGEIGMHTSRCLSRDFRAAHRDIHDLILTRSSAGKLARLLLSEFPEGDEDVDENNRLLMTHEEIGQRIGASRETVTRLLGRLRRKKLISLDGPTLIIRDRQGLKSLAL